MFIILRRITMDDYEEDSHEVLSDALKAIKLEIKTYKAELKDKTQHVVDLEAQLARVLDDNTQLRLLGE